MPASEEFGDQQVNYDDDDEDDHDYYHQGDQDDVDNDDHDVMTFMIMPIVFWLAGQQHWRNV